jgi:thiamine biosynthesis lipoprotein
MNPDWKKWFNAMQPKADYFLQVTIICKDSGKADALSKPVFIMPFDEGLKYINSFPDVAAMWVMKNGEKR